MQIGVIEVPSRKAILVQKLEDQIFLVIGIVEAEDPQSAAAEDLRKAESIVTEADKITDKADQYATEVVDNARARAEAARARFLNLTPFILNRSAFCCSS